MSEQLSPFEQQLKRNGAERIATVQGMFSAGFYIAIPALLTIPIMWIFGEGDYISALLSLLYVPMFVYGNRMRRTAEKRSARRSRGFWIAVNSLMMCALCAVLAITFLLEPGGWRYFG